MLYEYTNKDTQTRDCLLSKIEDLDMQLFIKNLRVEELSFENELLKDLNKFYKLLLRAQQ